ncbi:hypothetical protein D2Q93_05110 [Alicyclobacillaceae bacterium I2511]|nr:hypothetical protein D2Q93_05110 [Alicyclobacillaceae bacterium I2511]
MQILFIANDPPYGTERTYNALRHAIAVAKQPEVGVKFFFMADAVHCARRGQQTPNGYYNLEHMITVAVRRGVECGACGTCMDARALQEDALISGVHRSTLEELTEWTLWADKVIVY